MKQLVRVSTILTVAAAIASGTILFVTSQRVQRAEHHLAALHEQKIKEQDTIHVLHAEWDYLNCPDRLETLARQYLGMQAPDLKIVTADPRALSMPIETVSAPKRPGGLVTEQAVYHPPQSPTAAAHENEGSFQDLIHDLRHGDAPQ